MSERSFSDKDLEAELGEEQPLSSELTPLSDIIPQIQLILPKLCFQILD